MINNDEFLSEIFETVITFMPLLLSIIALRIGIKFILDCIGHDYTFFSKSESEEKDELFIIQDKQGEEITTFFGTEKEAKQYLKENQDTRLYKNSYKIKKAS